VNRCNAGAGEKYGKDLTKIQMVNGSAIHWSLDFNFHKSPLPSAELQWEFLPLHIDSKLHLVPEQISEECELRDVI